MENREKWQENQFAEQLFFVQVVKGPWCSLSVAPSSLYHQRAVLQAWGYLQVVVSFSAVLLLPPVDNNNGDSHANDEDCCNDTSHDPNNASWGTLR